MNSVKSFGQMILLCIVRKGYVTIFDFVRLSSFNRKDERLVVCIWKDTYKRLQDYIKMLALKERVFSKVRRSHISLCVQ